MWVGGTAGRIAVHAGAPQSLRLMLVPSRVEDEAHLTAEGTPSLSWALFQSLLEHVSGGNRCLLGHPDRPGQPFSVVDEDLRSSKDNNQLALMSNH